MGGDQNTMGRELDIPWVGDQIPWIGGSVYHGQGVKIQWVGDSICHGYGIPCTMGREGQNTMGR